LLEALAAQVVALANKVDDLTGEALAFAVSCQIGDAQIDAQRPVWLCFRRRVAALAEVQVIGVSTPDQISAANFPRGVYLHRLLAGTEYEATDGAALHGVERDAVQAHQPVRACSGADAVAWAKSGAG